MSKNVDCDFWIDQHHRDVVYMNWQSEQNHAAFLLIQKCRDILLDHAFTYHFGSANIDNGKDIYSLVTELNDFLSSHGKSHIPGKL
jgi:hypothetical protein